jgi:MFS family permease
VSGHERAVVSPFRQSKSVWAVAFACVVSFMGIGLVDPILPALSKQLKASPSSVELLFTSYLVVMAVAMLVTGWVSSRIGGKRTMIAGLIPIVAFSALARGIISGGVVLLDHSSVVQAAQARLILPSARVRLHEPAELTKTAIRPRTLATYNISSPTVTPPPPSIRGD